MVYRTYLVLSHPYSEPISAAVSSLNLSVVTSMLCFDGVWTSSSSNVAGNRLKFVLCMRTETVVFCDNCRKAPLPYALEILHCFIPAGTRLSFIFTTLPLPSIPRPLSIHCPRPRPCPTGTYFLAWSWLWVPPFHRKLFILL